MNYDYGHQKYLDQLSNQRATVLKAFERIERRTDEILYKNQKWFKWVRQSQDEDEAYREKEQKKVKLEAAMFRRHWKEVQQRLAERRAKEAQKKQDAYLDKVYKERLEQQEDDDDDDGWDPIEDVLEDNRDDFINLIKSFLWMAEPENTLAKETKKDVEATGEIDSTKNNVAPVEENEEGPTSSVDHKSDLVEVKTIEEIRDGKSEEEKASAPSTKSKASKKKKNKSSSGAQTSLVLPSSSGKNGDIVSGVKSLSLAKTSKQRLPTHRNNPKKWIKA